MRRLSLFPLITAPLLAGLVYFGCSKSAGTKEKPDEPVGTGPTGERIAVPGSKGGPVTGGAPIDDSRNKLAPEEGTLAVTPPSDAKAGAETIAKVVVTPGKEYVVNTEFPTKLTLENADGVTIAKAELKAGGQDKAQGDAEVFDESNLTFAVKLTPAKSGSYTVNGSFKFAVCDKAKTTCLAKKERIAIQVAAQ